MKDLGIRKARIEDAPQIAACIDAAYAQYLGHIDDLPDVSSGIAEDIATNMVWVAELDAEIAGVLILVANDGFMKLANVAVSPRHSGKGLGQHLIQHAEQMTQAQGFGELRLNTHAKMSANLKFYSRLGWVETGRSGMTVMMTKIF